MYLLHLQTLCPLVVKSLCCVMSCALVNEAVVKPTFKTKCKSKSKIHITVKTLVAHTVRLQKKSKVNCRYGMTNIPIQRNSSFRVPILKNTDCSAFKSQKSSAI